VGYGRVIASADPSRGTAAQEAQARLRRVALSNTVRVRKGQVPVGKGELSVADGVLVLTVRGKERMRAPVASVQRTLAPMFAHEAIRTARRWVPRLRYRVTFVDPSSGDKDSDADRRWGKFFYAAEGERERATALDRVTDTANAAASGVLSDRAWRRTGALGKQEGTLQLADGRLDFIGPGGEAVGLPLSEIKKVGAPLWASGRMTVTAGSERHVFGFAPRRLADGTWEEGPIRSDGERPTSGPGLGDAAPDSSGYVSSSQAAVDASEFANGLVILGGLVVLACEGNYTRRIRRRDWKRALGGDGAADELLATRADKARTKLEQHDLLNDRS
jgi:hypothetical protein